MKTIHKSVSNVEDRLKNKFGTEALARSFIESLRIFFLEVIELNNRAYEIKDEDIIREKWGEWFYETSKLYNFYPVYRDYLKEASEDMFNVAEGLKITLDLAGVKNGKRVEKEQ
jgi:hypothetical protein